MSDHLEDEATIQRCPHDKINQYSLISNKLIRDPNLSPHVCWLIIFLLSNKEGWVINVQQVVNFLKGKKGYGRDNVEEMFKEAIESGYMKKEIEMNGNLRGKTKYFISEEPKFKKSLRHPEVQGPESQEAENQGYKNNHVKDVPLERSDCIPPEAEPDKQLSDEETINKKNSKGLEIEINKSEIMATALRKGENWQLPEIQEAWQALVNNPGIVNDAYNYIEKTIKNNRRTNYLNKHKENRCSTKKQSVPDLSKGKSSEESSNVNLWDHLVSMGLFPPN
jgi:hypothetical protein